MAQVLYRKYRSKNLDELVGQDHITRSIRLAIEQNKIAHAYLLTGPRGTGKTSVARIIAHEINGFEYDEKCSHIDIIEIDAASNRRIDEIRDLRDKIRIAPTAGRYKVYIIDEVHMLTREAFNALLKTLEEPPEHAIFILATTEIQKVPETIISRTQRFTFRPIQKSDLVRHLADIAKNESIDIDQTALNVIAEHANGGFRDAISLLDQVRSLGGKITTETVHEVLGMPSSQLIETVWSMLSTSSDNTAKKIQDLYNDGYRPAQIIQSLLEIAIATRNTALAKKLLEASGSKHPDMELLLLAIPDSVLPAAALMQPAPPIPSPKEEYPVKHNNIKRDPETEIKAAIDKVDSSSHEETHIESDTWLNVLEHIKSTGSAVYGPLRLAEVKIHNDILQLGLQFPFHIKRISESQNLKILTDAITAVTGKAMAVEITKTTKSPSRHDEKKVLLNDISDPDKELMSDPLSIVKNVFGGAEVL
jgi:DNA polymerase III subunit gamma/tau